MGGGVDWEAAGDIIDAGGEIVGSVAVPAGMASTVRIPVPGTKGLAIELSPRGWTPKGGTTSTLFIQSLDGKRQLRLDYGFNKTTGAVDFHWNQKGVADVFGKTDHTPAGRGGAALYRGARYFRYAGRALMVVGAATDAYSVVVSDRPFAQLMIVSGGWAAAWAGCKMFGAAGAAGGTAVEPGGGTAVGGIAGCFFGAAVGYWAGKTLVTMAVGSPDAERVQRTVEEFHPPPGFEVVPVAPPSRRGGTTAGGGATGAW